MLSRRLVIAAGSQLLGGSIVNRRNMLELAPAAAGRLSALRRSSIRVAIAGVVLTTSGLLMEHETLLLFGGGCALLIVVYEVGRQRLSVRVRSAGASPDALAAAERHYLRIRAGQFASGALLCVAAASTELGSPDQRLPAVHRVLGWVFVVFALAFIIQGARTWASSRHVGR